MIEEEGLDHHHHLNSTHCNCPNRSAVEALRRTRTNCCFHFSAASVNFFSDSSAAWAIALQGTQHAQVQGADEGECARPRSCDGIA